MNDKYQDEANKILNELNPPPFYISKPIKISALDRTWLKIAVAWEIARIFMDSIIASIKSRD